MFNIDMLYIYNIFRGEKMLQNNMVATCCILGHRNIHTSRELESKLYDTIEFLITEKKVEAFLFGSNSGFFPLCLNITTKLKEKHTHIKRIFVRAEFPKIDNNYESYLLDFYDYTYYPEEIINAGKAVYVERNYHMINNSQFCIIYYNESFKPSQRKSGTEIALNYAIKHKKTIYLFP